MTSTRHQLLEPTSAALLMVDHQAGLLFGVESSDRQQLVQNVCALAETAVAFSLPVVASTSASRVYSGPMLPRIQAALPGVTPIERKNMNVWEDDAARSAVTALRRPRLLVSGLLTEACVSFPVLSALADGLDVFVVADACGGRSRETHEIALQRLRDAGAQVTSWLQVLLELQRDWTRKDTYAAARGIVETYGGGYGVGLAYARDMIHPTS